MELFGSFEAVWRRLPVAASGANIRIFSTVQALLMVRTLDAWVLGRTNLDEVYFSTWVLYRFSVAVAISLRRRYAVAGPIIRFPGRRGVSFSIMGDLSAVVEILGVLAPIARILYHSGTILYADTQG